MRTTFVVMLALLWAPLASHCLLESVLASEFLACCDHQDAAASHEGGCHDDSCATVENGQYQSAQQRLTVLPPDWQFDLESIVPALTALSPGFPLPGATAAAAPPPAPWQFAFRTALPPRAPSLVS